MKLTQKTGPPVYVNPAQVVYVEADERSGRTRVYFNHLQDGCLIFLEVDEAPAGVQGLFLEPLR